MPGGATSGTGCSPDLVPDKVSNSSLQIPGLSDKLLAGQELCSAFPPHESLGCDYRQQRPERCLEDRRKD